MVSYKWLKQKEQQLRCWAPVEVDQVEAKKKLEAEVVAGWEERHQSVISALHQDVDLEGSKVLRCSGCGAHASLAPQAVQVIPHTKKCGVAGRYLDVGGDLQGYSDAALAELRMGHVR